MKITVLILRSLLGVIYVVFGLNFFLHFIALPTPGGAAGTFEGGLFVAGYFFPFMKVIEILSGLFLLINKYTALIVLIIFPITLNIFLFHAFLEPQGLSMGAPMLLINLFLGWAYRKYYTPIFTASPVL
jgi:hypothetical protein